MAYHTDGLAGPLAAGPSDLGEAVLPDGLAGALLERATVGTPDLLLNIQEKVQNEPALFGALTLGFLAGLAIMVVGGKTFNVGFLIKNTPPEKVRSVAVGRTELHGTARDAGVVFDQPFTGGKCLYYSYKVEERREKRVQDEDGNTRTEKEWETVSSDSLAAPFYVDDGTGEMLVLANAGAKFHITDENSLKEKFGKGRAVPSRYKGSFDTTVDVRDAVPEDVDWEPHSRVSKVISKLPGLSSGGTVETMLKDSAATPQAPSFGSTHRKRRIKQEVLPVDSDVYVFGAATIREGVGGANEDRLLIRGDDDTGQFIISDAGETKVARKYQLMGVGMLALGLVVSAVTLRFLAPAVLASLG